MRVENNYYNGQNSNVDKDQRNKLSIDDFLQIMVAEIQNMNPLSEEGGGSKTDYISQMAQFTTLEQMSSIAEGIVLLNLMGQQQYSFSLIGKEVSLAYGDEIVTGVVDKVKLQYGQIMLRINDEDYSVENLIEVGIAEVNG